MKINTYYEFIKESAQSEQTVKILTDIILEEVKEYDSEDFKYLNDETDFVVIDSTYEEIHEDIFPRLRITIDENLIKTHKDKIESRVYDAISKYNLYIDLTLIGEVGFTGGTQASILLDLESYDLTDINIVIYGTLDLYKDSKMVKLRSSIVHELKHYYEYIISKGKAFNKDIESKTIKNSVKDALYYNSKTELSARLTQFIDANREDIENGKMSKVKIFNSLYQNVLYKNDVLTDESTKWAIKKAIAYINNIQNKNKEKLNIENKVRKIADTYGINIIHEKYNKYSPYFIKNGMLTETALVELTRLCDIYRYDLVIGSDCDITNVNLSKYKFEYLDENKEETLMKILSLPNNSMYYRESKRK
jgi:hypothetical protein